MLPFLLLVIGRIAGFNGLYGQDSHEYLRFSKLLQGALIGVNEFPDQFYWPINYPLVGAILALLLPMMDLALQLVSLGSLVLSAWWVQQLLERYHPNKETQIRLFVGLFLLFSPLLLRASVLVMSDLLGMLGIVGFWRAVHAYREEVALRYMFGAVLSAYLAVFSRFPAAIVVGILGLGWMFQLIQKREWLTIFWVFFFTCALGMLYWVWHPPLDGVSENSFLKQWSWEHWFQRDFETIDGEGHYRFPNLLFAFGNFWLPTFGLGVWISVWGLRKVDWKHQDRLIFAIAVAINGLFLAGLSFQNARTLYLSYPLLLIIVFPGFLRMWEWSRTKVKIRWLVLAGIATLQLLLFARGFHQFFHDQQVQAHIAKKLHAYPEERKVYTFAIDQALRTYKVQQPVMNLWLKPYGAFADSSLLLFQPDLFGNENAPANVWTNWQEIQANYELQVQDSLPKGWVLWTIQKKE